jgi:NTP pyrophosphatase (non-canonical NTP hydrolase)
MRKNQTMNFSEYQKKARSMAVYPRTQGLVYLSLGLAGEAGEVANQAKKTIRDDSGIVTSSRREMVLDEHREAVT